MKSEVFRLNMLNTLSAISQKRALAQLPVQLGTAEERLRHFISTLFPGCEGEVEIVIKMKELAKYIGDSRLITSRILMKDPKKQRDLDLRYLRMAQIWSENSYCQRRQVGALVVKDKMIISDGYNGTPSGFENVCEEDGVTKPYVLHAEANAITKIARSGNNSDGSTLYVTD